MLETPGMDFISLLLTGGGCRTSFGGLVRHTGSPAALMRIPVIPGRGRAWVRKDWRLSSQHSPNSSFPINLLSSSPGESSHNSWILYPHFPQKLIYSLTYLQLHAFLSVISSSPNSSYPSHAIPRITISFINIQILSFFPTNAHDLFHHSDFSTLT